MAGIVGEKSMHPAPERWTGWRYRYHCALWFVRLLRGDRLFLITLFLDARMNLPDSPLAHAQALAAE
jgi:hypothetical protein